MPLNDRKLFSFELGAALNLEETLQLAAEMAGVGTWYLLVLEGELRSSPRCKEIFGLFPENQFRYEDFISSVHPDADSAHMYRDLAQWERCFGRA